MKFNLLLLLLLTFAFSVFAQTSPTAAQVRVMRLAPQNDKFAVLLPAARVSDISNPFNKSGAHGFTTFADDIYFHVFTDTTDDREQSKKVREFIKYSKSTPAKFEVSKWESEEYRFTDDDGFYYRIVFVKTAKRTYIFQTTQASESSAGSECFFDSIEIEGQALNLKSHLPAAATVVTAPVKNSPPDSQISDEMRQSIFPQTTPLLIKSKELPRYTQHAAFYGETGTIKLRVTFLANGMIGEVIALIKLPFGLTAKGFEAARAMKFQPATINGSPANVTKQVEYSYSLY